MDWEEAKRNTLNLWSSIYNLVGKTDSVTLLTEINAIADLCVLAGEEAREHGDLDKCHFCPAYIQFGGCRDVCGELSDLVARKEWDQVRATIESLMVTLEGMEASATSVT